MDADYSLELGPTAPALEIPWKDPEGRLHYVDLRGARFLIARVADASVGSRIPEARQFPALRRFLLAVNSPPSPWQTAKCDVWPDEAEACREPLRCRDLSRAAMWTLCSPGGPPLCAKTWKFISGWQKSWRDQLETNEALEATAEIVVRRCYFHRRADAEESDAGYCLTLFLTGYGASPAEAAECWDRAMEFAAACVLKLQPHEGRAQSRRTQLKWMRAPAQPTWERSSVG